MGMFRQASSDHAAVECVPRGKQRGGAVTFVIVRHRLAAALLTRQPGRSAIEGLDLRLLIERKDQGVLGWMQVESNDGVEFVGETGVVAELEGLDPMGLEAVGAPKAAPSPRFRCSATPGLSYSDFAQILPVALADWEGLVERGGIHILFYNRPAFVIHFA